MEGSCLPGARTLVRRKLKIASRYLLHVVQTVNCCCPRTPGVTGTVRSGHTGAWSPVVTSGHPPQPADQWRQTLRGWPAACHRKLARESRLCLQI